MFVAWMQMQLLLTMCCKYEYTSFSIGWDIKPVTQKGVNK